MTGYRVEWPKYSSIDYFRVFLTILVVFFHSILSYSYTKVGAIIVDKESFLCFDFFEGFFDSFMMYAFFFISGLFIWASLQKKGAWKWLLNRIKRLGLPFMAGVLTLNVITYLLSTDSGFSLNTDRYWRVTGSGIATSGYHLWFLWILLVFGILIAFTYKIFPDIGCRIMRSKTGFFTRPWAFLLIFGIFSCVCYVILIVAFGPVFIGIGPFSFQISRILIYFMFFLVGVLVGIYKPNRPLFNKNSLFVKLWWLQVLISFMIYCIIFTLYAAAETNAELSYLYLLTYPLTPFVAVLMTVGLLNGFSLLTNKPNKVIRNLSNNSFCIYIVHYSIVTALQRILLEYNLSGIIKAMLVFSVAFPLSWLISELWLRIIRLLKKFASSQKHTSS